MRDVPGLVRTELDKHNGLVVKPLVWMTAKHIASGAIQSVGFWYGDSDQTFTINGQSRGYYGFPALMKFEDMQQQTGLYVKQYKFTMANLTEEIQTLLLAYQLRGAPIEIHQAFFSPDTNNLLANPTRMFKGWINKAQPSSAGVNGRSELSISCVGNSRTLTKLLPQRKSHETQKLRNGGDLFFRDVAVTGTITTPWGDKLVGKNLELRRIRD